MANTESEVQEAIFQAIIAAVEDKAEIQFPLRSFQPPSNRKWIEVVKIVNNPTNEYWGKERTFQGIIRLLLHWPIDNAGLLAPTRLLEEIAPKLAKGSRFGSVYINDHPSIENPIILENGAIIPMTLPYRCFVV